MEMGVVSYQLHVTCIILSVICFSFCTEAEPINAEAGGSTFLPCRAIANRDNIVGVMWYKDGVFMVGFNPSNKKKSFADDGLRARLTLNATGMGLSELILSDSGDYLCKAVMQDLKPDDPSILEENSTETLLVQDVPGPPGKPNITDITSRSMVVTWSLDIDDNNSPITLFVIQIRSSFQPSWSEGRELMVAKDTSRLTIRELLPYTQYQVRLTARNSVGRGAPSEPTDYTYSSSERPDVSPQIIDIKSPSNSSIKLSWKPLPRENLNGVLKSYRIVYGVLGSNEVQVATIQDPNKTVAVIENLKPYTDYEIQLTAQNDIGESHSSRAILKTSEGYPGKPRITHVSERTPDSFLVHWEPPDVMNGVLRSYELLWVQNSSSLTRILTGALTNPMFARIDMLQPYTQYEIKISASTGAGKGEYSNLYPALTDVDEPSAPSIVNMSVLSPTSVFLQWENPKVFYKQIDSYLIEYKAEGDTSYWPKNTPDGYVHEYILEKLRTNSKYEVTVTGITNSIFSKTTYLGKASKPVYVRLTDPNTIIAKGDNFFTAGIIAGLAVTGVVLMVGIAALIGISF